MVKEINNNYQCEEWCGENHSHNLNIIKNAKNLKGG